MVDAIVHHLPLLSKDDVILLNHVLNNIGCGQDLLAILLSICLNPMDLGPMGSLLLFSIVHLERERH